MKRLCLSVGAGIALFFLLSQITMTLETWFGFTGEASTPFHIWLFLPFYLMQGAIPLRDQLDPARLTTNMLIAGMVFHFVVFSLLSFWLLGKLPNRKRAITRKIFKTGN